MNPIDAAIGGLFIALAIIAAIVLTSAISVSVRKLKPRGHLCGTCMRAFRSSSAVHYHALKIHGHPVLIGKTDPKGEK